MNETTFGYPWDISWSTDINEDTVMVEYEGSDLYLSYNDLKEMLNVLEGEEK